MASLNEDKELPVLRVSYQQLYDRLSGSQDHKHEDDTQKNTTMIEKGVESSGPRSGGIIHVSGDLIHSMKDKEISCKKRSYSKGRERDDLTSVQKDSTNVWEWVWSEWNKYEIDLDNMLSRWSGSCDVSLDRIYSQCYHLECLVHQLYSDHTDIVFKHDILSKLWRTCHYPVTEVLRRYYKRSSQSHKQEFSTHLLRFYDQVNLFYSGLIKTLQKVCKFQVTQLTEDNMKYSSRSHQKMVRYAVHTCHQCYICLGDISRYCEEISDKADWSKPRNYYLKAVQLAPKDGKPYNQLAVIAINAHRRLDTAYYYIRSLCAKNVFLSAYDSLVAIFDETAKKAQIEEEKQKQKKHEKPHSRNKASKLTKKNLLHDTSGRKEIWIMPGQQKNEKQERDDKKGYECSDVASHVINDNRWMNIEHSELSRLLTNYFLIVHGKLFTKIGIDAFNNSMNDVLSLLGLYLDTMELTIHNDGSKFMKMIAINIFSIHHVVNNIQDNANDYYLILSLCLNLEITKCLISCCVKQLDHMMSHDQPNHMIILLPAIRIWINWFSKHTSLWYPVMSHDRVKSCMYHFLLELSNLLNQCQKSLPLDLDIPASATYSCSKLWEDKMLAGFTPLTVEDGISVDDVVCIPDVIQLTDEQLFYQSLSRVGLVIHTGVQMCSNDVIPLKQEMSVFHVTMEPPVTIVPKNKLETKEEDDVEEEEEECSSLDVTDVSSQIHQLKIEKERLSEEMKLQHNTEETAQSLLDEASKKRNDVIIKPRYLVPDTNCFIDCLQNLKDLIDTGYFILAIPLTVIAELEGLSKGDIQRSVSGRIDQSAKFAVEYIRSEMSSTSPRLKGLTSQGSLLSSLTFTTEVTDKTTNDDTILTSCVKLHHRVDQLMEVGSSETHSVVLLTDDRNLRVKSHASHMPVRSVQVFMELFLQKS